jgi:uncharacterized protein (DUF952 family)
MIWHLLPLAQWRADPGSWCVPGTAGAVPFVHASPDEGVMLAVANAFYRPAGEPLVALALDEELITAPVRWEPPDPSPPPGVPAGTLFPHVYGPLDRAAVTGLRYLRADVTGRFVALDERPPTAEALGLLPHPEGGWSTSQPSEAANELVSRDVRVPPQEQDEVGGGHDPGEVDEQLES